MANEYNKRTALPANSDTAVAEAPGDRGLRCHINIVSRNAGPVKVRVYLDTAASPADGDYLEYDGDILPGIPLIRGPFVLNANEKIYARVDTANCGCVAMGEKAWTP